MTDYADDDTPDAPVHAEREHRPLSEEQGSEGNVDQRFTTVGNGGTVSTSCSARESSSTSDHCEVTKPYTSQKNRSTRKQEAEACNGEEHQIQSTTAAQETTILEANRHLTRRRVHQYDSVQSALRKASKALDTKAMIDHLETILENPAPEHQDEACHLYPKLKEYRASLYDAVANHDMDEITDVQGVVETLLLSYDPKHLENIEARKLDIRQAVRDNEPPRPIPSWKQNPAYRFLSMLKGDFTGEANLVTRKQVRYFLSRGAWVLAFFLLIIAIAFSSVQFVESLSRPALSTDLNRYEKLQLPVVWACLTKPMFPMFENLPNETYVGWQFWGLRSYTNIETDETYTYPDTKKLISESKILGSTDYCQDNMQYLSKHAIDLGSQHFREDSSRCYSCLRVGIKKSVTLEYAKALNRPAGAVTLEFAVLKDLDYCFGEEIPVSGFPRTVLKADLKRHGQRLVDSGAVVLENKVGIDFALDYGFESYDQLGNPYLKIEMEATVFCNLFFLSGTFYPVRNEERIRYSFDLGRGVDSWMPIGDPNNFLDVKIGAGKHWVDNINRTKMLSDFKLIDVADTARVSHMSVNIYSVVNTTTTQPTSRHFSGLLRENTNDVMVYTKKVESGVVEFSSRLQRGAARVFQGQSRFFRSNLSLDFAAFDVEDSVKVPTTTWAEFLTDVFEYVGLFTGICAYSVLVAPAKVYLRRIQKYERYRSTFSVPTTR